MTDFKSLPRRSLWIFAAAVLATVVVPSWAAGRRARAFYEGDPQTQRELGRGVARWIGSALDARAFDTGHELFDREWLFGTYMMAAMGFGQTSLEHPELEATHLPLMETCLEQLLSRELRRFDASSWGDDPVDTLGKDRGHVAYLGYLNLALSLHRTIRTDSRFADLNDRITAALVRRFGSSPAGLIETYPGETYPVDNLAAFASIGLHAQATRTDAGVALRSIRLNFARRYLDSATGLLFQRVDWSSGAPVDAPRGSGSALGAYFAGFADTPLACNLGTAVRRELGTEVLGFAAMAEYPSGYTGSGDIDSGPLLFGLSISSTGFSLANARMMGDAAGFARLFSTAELFGGYRLRDGIGEFAMGGPLGNALMFALLTAPRRECEVTS